MRDNGAFSCESLDVGGLFFEIADRNEERKVGVLVTGVFEPLIELFLDLLPETVSPGLDHHAAADLRILGEVGGADDLLIPLRKIFLPGGGDRILGSFGHGR